MYREIGTIAFPEARDINVNMMPIVFGDLNSVPKSLRHYWDLISKCDLLEKSVVYLTIHEGMVKQGQTLRRPGIHTDATNEFGWGGGGWGSVEGIYMTSTDGRCRVWDCVTNDVDELGSCGVPNAFSEIMKPNMLYWMTDRTPHESLPAKETAPRQFFRLVSQGIGAWYTKHNTPNPLGVQPEAVIVDHDKFER